MDGSRKLSEHVRQIIEIAKKLTPVGSSIDVGTIERLEKQLSKEGHSAANSIFELAQVCWPLHHRPHYPYYTRSDLWRSIRRRGHSAATKRDV